jgi:hypothetical protein
LIAFTGLRTEESLHRPENASFAFAGDSGTAGSLPVKVGLGHSAQRQLGYVFGSAFDFLDLSSLVGEKLELGAKRFCWVAGVGVFLMLLAAGITPAEPDEWGVRFSSAGRAAT